MKRRLLTVTLAVLLALAGTAGVLAYVHGANKRALQGQRPVAVLVASRTVPAGTSAGAALQQKLLTKQVLPASAVPVDAVRSLGGGLDSLVLSAALPPGQLLLRPMLVTAAAATAQGALAIPRGKVAVTVPLCMPAAVAGYVQAGSEVAVFDTYGGKNSSVQANCGQSGQGPPAAGGGGGGGAVHTRIVLPRALVLSVGAAGGSAGHASGLLAQPGSGGSTSSSSATQLITFAVSQADAERLILLSETGVAYLALLTPSSQTGFDATTPAPLFQP